MYKNTAVSARPAPKKMSLMAATGFLTAIPYHHVCMDYSDKRISFFSPKNHAEEAERLYLGFPTRLFFSFRGRVSGKHADMLILK